MQVQKKRTTAEIIRILREVEEGLPIQEACRTYNMSRVTLYRWKEQYAKMRPNMATRFKELGKQCRELKIMLAEALLEVRALKASTEKQS
jgi:putative transposase